MSMPTRQAELIEIDEAGTELAELVSRLEAEPERAIAVLRQRATAAVLLHPTMFQNLLEAAQTTIDVAAAETVLATEPLSSFADYHERRLARRRARASG